MSPMDVDPRADVPPVVRNYVETRRRWLEVAYDPERRWDASWGRYALAHEALRAELVRRGRRWEVGGLVYVLDPDRGIAIEQAADRRDEETLAAIKADLTARKSDGS